MAKKIKKNSSFSYNNRTVKNQTTATEVEKLEENLPDVLAENSSWIKRLGAYVIDIISYVPLMLLLNHTAVVMRNSGNSQDSTQATYMSLSIICLAFLLFGYLPHRWQGQTLGKKLLNIRIVPTNGKKVEFYKYLLREFIAKITFGIFIVPAVVLYALFQKYVKKEQNPILLHDIILNTRVVNATKIVKEKSKN